MIIERSMHPGWLSNTYLVADRPGGHGVLIDTGGPPGPILQKLAELKITVTNALCTHHHHDHVANNALFREKLGCTVAGHVKESRYFGDLDDPTSTVSKLAHSRRAFLLQEDLGTHPKVVYLAEGDLQ